MLTRFSILLLFLALVYFDGSAQYLGAPYIQNYPNGTYPGHAQVWCATQDNYGNMYFGTTTGITVYDGEKWREIHTDNNSITRSLDVSKYGIIYVGGIKTFGYLQPDSTGKLNYVPLENLLDSGFVFSNVWETFCVDDKVYFRSVEALFQYSPGKNQIKYWKPNSRFNPGCYMPGKGVIVRDGNQYFVLQNDSLHALPESKLLEDYFIYKLIPRNEHEFFGISRNQIFVFDTESKNSEPARVYLNSVGKAFQGTSLYMGAKLNSNELAVGSITAGLFTLSEKGENYFQFDKSVGIQMNHVWSTFQDHDNLLWLTLDKGITNIHYASPVRTWNGQMDFDESINDIIEFENCVYLSTMSGVFCMERNINDSTFTSLKPKKLKQTLTASWAFKIISDPVTNKGVLFVATSDGPAIVTNNEVKRVANISYNFNITQHPTNKRLLYVSTLDKVTIIDASSYSVLKEIVIEGQSRYFEFSNDSTFWVGTNYKGIYRINLRADGTYEDGVIKNYGEKEGFQLVLQLKPVLINDTLFVSSTKGIYYYNARKDRFDIYTHFNFVEDPSSMQVLEISQKGNDLAILANSNLYHIDMLSRKIDSVGYKLFSKEQLHNVYIDNYKNIWAAGPAGLYLYDQKYSKEQSFSPRVTIRNVIFNKDSSLFNGTYFTHVNGKIATQLLQPSHMKPVLPYQHNSIIFEYASPYFIKEKDKRYKYILAGYDKQWSDWTTETKKEYTNLPPGTYIFSVKAKNVYGMESDMAKYQFKIENPWYRTIWAFIIYLLILVVIVIFIIRWRTNALKHRNKLLEDQVAIRTSELNQKNEELETQTEYLKFVNSELKKLSIAASETTNAIIIMDKNGEIEWINEGFTKLYGYNILELKEEFGENIVTASRNDNIKKIFHEVVTQKKSQIYQSVMPTKNGYEIDIQTNLSPILNDEGEIITVVAIDSDIRKLKKAENELKKLNDTKDKFFSIVAHDLKNPFAALLQLSELTINNMEEWDQDKLKFILKNMHKASKDGYDLLINLLDWSRAQLGRIKISPEVLNLRSLIQQNVNLLSQQAQNKNITLRNNVSERINVRTDKNSALTVFRNIISNAIKFTPQGGEVKVTATIDDRYVSIQISDNGVGMKPEKVENLFKIEQDVSSPGTENESGTGLGLILCKEFVERNNGSISVESTLNVGTVFYIDLLKA